MRNYALGIVFFIVMLMALTLFLKEGQVVVVPVTHPIATGGNGEPPSANQPQPVYPPDVVEPAPAPPHPIKPKPWDPYHF